MKKQIAFIFSCFVVILFFATCKKSENLQLQGSASVAEFSFTLSPSGIPDSLPYTTSVAFTNNSTDGFIYEWDFGDNSNTTVEKDPVHVYTQPQLYDVKLTSVGTNGSSVISKKIQINGACAVDVFAKLTNCLKKEWVMSFDADAIQVWSPDSTQLYYSGAPETTCQGDDVYTFNNNGAFSYDAKGATFVANEQPFPYSCQEAKPNATSYKLVVKPGMFPRIVLNPAGLPDGRKPFMGTTDVVVENAYDILSYSSSTMVLRGRLTDGSQLILKLRENAVLSLDDIKQILTNGSSKSWRLDSTAGANTIVVGIEASPTLYFAGGPLADCQKDDVYTFKVDNTISYNANGSTFVAGDFTCQDDKSYSNIPYIYTAMTTADAGIAQIILPNDPAVFLGTTDAPKNCRILSISSTKMLIRAGDPSGTIFTMKFVAE